MRKDYKEFKQLDFMNFKKLKNGDSLKINGKTYEVLYNQMEADIAKPPQYKARTFLAIYLHRSGSKSLHPTNQLWYYPDKKEIYFVSEKSKIKLQLEDIAPAG